MIQKDFGDNAMSAGQIKVWHKCSKDGRESVESNPCSGRPATSITPENVEHEWGAIDNHQRSVIDSMRTKANVGIPKTTVSEILMNNLGIKCVMAKLGLWLLLADQKEHRAAVANDLIQTATNEPDFLKKVITRDESWVYGYELETKAQSSQWKSLGPPCLKKARQSCSKIKTMLTVFFN